MSEQCFKPRHPTRCFHVEKTRFIISLYLSAFSLSTTVLVCTYIRMCVSFSFKQRNAKCQPQPFVFTHILRKYTIKLIVHNGLKTKRRYNVDLKLNTSYILGTV